MNLNERNEVELIILEDGGQFVDPSSLENPAQSDDQNDVPNFKKPNSK